MAKTRRRTKPFARVDKLAVAMAHNPLNSRSGKESVIKGPDKQMCRITQTISTWKFDIRHYPGKAMFFADTTSRYLILAKEKDMETAFLAARAVPMDKVASSAKNDNAHQANCAALSASTAPAPSACKELHRYRDKLCPRDGILRYDDRPAIPHGIRV